METKRVAKIPLQSDGVHAVGRYLDGIEDVHPHLDEIGYQAADSTAGVVHDPLPVLLGLGDEPLQAGLDELAEHPGADHQPVLHANVVGDEVDVGEIAHGLQNAPVELKVEPLHPFDDGLRQVGIQRQVRHELFHATQEHGQAQDTGSVRPGITDDEGVLAQGFAGRAQALVVEPVGVGPGVSFDVGDGLSIGQRRFDDLFKRPDHTLAEAPPVHPTAVIKSGQGWPDVVRPDGAQVNTQGLPDAFVIVQAKVSAQVVGDGRQGPQVHWHAVRFNVIDGSQHPLLAIHLAKPRSRSRNSRGSAAVHRSIVKTALILLCLQRISAPHPSIHKPHLLVFFIHVSRSLPHLMGRPVVPFPLLRSPFQSPADRC